MPKFYLFLVNVQNGYFGCWKRILIVKKYIYNNSITEFRKLLQQQNILKYLTDE